VGQKYKFGGERGVITGVVIFGSAPKKQLRGFSLVFVIPISIVVRIDLRGKKGVMMQKANVSPGKPTMDKMVRRRELPAFVVEGRCIKGEPLVVWCQMSTERKRC
jgi:hypothetical protein